MTRMAAGVTPTITGGDVIEGSAHTAEVPIPFNLTPSDLVLDHPEPGLTLPGAMHDLHWLVSSCTHMDPSEELAQVLTSAVLLFHADAGPLEQCIHTAIVWERG